MCHGCSVLSHHLPRGDGGTQGSCRRISWDPAILLTPTPASSAGFGRQDGMRKGGEETLQEEEEEQKGKWRGGEGVTELETVLSRSCRPPFLLPLSWHTVGAQ